MPSVLGVIPARGGSKGIPRKNIIELGGMPLIGHTIMAAANATLLSNVVVSTDCPDIAAVAEGLGASVPFMRPACLATDAAGSVGVVLHALEEVERIGGEKYDAVVLLQPTTPFRSSELIDKSVRELFEHNCDSVVSVVDVGANHPHRMYQIDDAGLLHQLMPEVEESMKPRQELPPVYIRSGDIYATTRQCLLEQGSLMGGTVRAICVDPEIAINIDTSLDLEIASMRFSSDALDI